MKKLYFLSTIIAFAFVVTACTSQQQQEAADILTNDIMMENDVTTHDDSTIKNDAIKDDDSSMEEDEVMMNDESDEFIARLVDVSGGTATGIAQASFSDGRYVLLATFDNLPQPSGTDFYEGWVVRKNPLNIISTGKAFNVDGEYSNTFNFGQNLTDHDFYVLTIEPDDGDPAPAGHILEGTLIKKNNN